MGFEQAWTAPMMILCGSWIEAREGSTENRECFYRFTRRRETSTSNNRHPDSRSQRFLHQNSARTSFLSHPGHTFSTPLPPTLHCPNKCDVNSMSRRYSSCNFSNCRPGTSLLDPNIFWTPRVQTFVIRAFPQSKRPSFKTIQNKYQNCLFVNRDLQGFGN